MLSDRAAIAANRFGLGARPGDGAAIGADPRGWLERQLAAGERASRPAAPPSSSSAAVLQKMHELRIARQLGRAARQRAASQRGPAPSERGAAQQPANAGVDEQALREYRDFVRESYLQQADDRHRRALETDEPFVERLVHFWSNHFAVSADKSLVAPICGLYEQEAIRPHVLGNFRDLLLAAERHPAMNLYLDNTASMGASSAAAKLARERGRELGLNENLAREILELHTLGVDGGYGQADVTELAKVLTGWSIGGEIGQRAPGGGRAAALGAGAGGAPGEFFFRPLMHEPGDKTVLGKRYRERGVEEGEAVLAALAAHPATARHLATKLARHFVADDPPRALIDRLAKTYLEHDGALAPVYRALIGSDESWREPLAKYKTPQDFVMSAYRALGIVPQQLRPITAFLGELGQRPFTPGSPAGWPDTAAAWDGGDALLKRVEWAGAVGRRIGDRIDALERANTALPVSTDEHTLAGIRGAESGAQGLALLIAAPEFQRR